MMNLYAVHVSQSMLSTRDVALGCGGGGTLLHVLILESEFC